MGEDEMIIINQLIKMTWLVDNESKDCWEENRIILRNLYYSDIYNIEYYLRAISECWYILTNWHFINKSNLKYNNFKSDLIEYWNIGYRLFSREERFIWMVGNMVTMFPELFTREDNCELELENMGGELLKRGICMYPDNIFIKIIYEGTLSNNITSFNKTGIAEIIENLHSYFPGNSRIEEYYIEFFEKYDTY